MGCQTAVLPSFLKAPTAVSRRPADTQICAGLALATFLSTPFPSPRDGDGSQGVKRSQNYNSMVVVMYAGRQQDNKKETNCMSVCLLVA